MNTMLVILSFFACLSFISTVLILFAVARSSQISRWEEGTGQWVDHEREAGSETVGELRSETASAS